MDASKAMAAMATNEGVANVTFEPVCRNNWHIHRGEKGGGQILLVTGGRAGIRNGAKKLRNFIQEMWLPYLSA